MNPDSRGEKGIYYYILFGLVLIAVIVSVNFFGLPGSWAAVIMAALFIGILVFG